jgi:hypothetical protein
MIRLRKFHSKGLQNRPLNCQMWISFEGVYDVLKSWNTCIVPILGLPLQSLVKTINFNVGQYGELYILIQGGKWQFHPSLGHGEFCGSILTCDPLVHNFGSKCISRHFFLLVHLICEWIRLEKLVMVPSQNFCKTFLF